MKRLFAALLLVTLVASTVAAQNAPRPPRAPRAPEAPRQAAPPRVPSPEPLSHYDENAQETRQRLAEALLQYPPSLVEVLRLDPSLLTNQAYLEPYPAVAAFLSQHPEVAHNPGFFLGQLHELGLRRYGGDEDVKVALVRSLTDGLFPIVFLIGFVTVIGTIGWLLRSAIEHRRWLRMSKIQTDAHTKLLDRLTSNEDLMAYVQSPAGRRFLEAAPIPLDAGPRALSAPLGRILWSVQAGCVVAFAGGGLMYSSTRFASNSTFSAVELPFFVMGATAVAIGAGFVVSSIVAYALSRRLGLLSPAATAPVPDAGTSQIS
jgi:hypothetical protein